MTHFSLDPNMTDVDWDAAAKIAWAQQRCLCEDGYDPECPRHGEW